MSDIQIQKIIGINDVTPTKELSYFSYPVTYFDLNSFKLASQLIVSFKPGFGLFRSGWIVDGKYLVTDDGLILGEGFSWSVGQIGYYLATKNKELNIVPSETNMTISGFGFVANHAYDAENENHVTREFSDETVENAIFLGGFDNLSHFMMEIAPKTLLLPRLLNNSQGINKLCSSEIVPKKWLDYALGVAESATEKSFNVEMQRFNSDKLVRFKNIVAISSIMFRGSDKLIRMAVREAQFFSKQMQKTSKSPDISRPYVLYLSRKNANHRRILNQDNLIEIIKKEFKEYDLIVEEKIYALPMEEQAKLIHNASIVIEEGGGSTGFTSNLVGHHMPYVCIASNQRTSQAGKIYIAGLGTYAAWVLGEPVGELSKSVLIDNDLKVDEKEFRYLMQRLLIFIESKLSLPKIDLTGIV